MNLKKYSRLLSLTGVVLLSTISCKQRDDWPVFGEPEVVPVVKDTIPPDNEIGAITKLIMDKSDIIKTFRMDSTVSLGDGITHTHVRFLNKLGQPMSMHIAEVNLSKSNITAQALSPFDDYQYTLQTISDMAQYNEGRSGGKIMIAINGDGITSGAPTGSFIKSGRQLKTNTTTATTNVRPFFAVKYDGTPYIGNRPNTTVPLDAYNLNDFKHLVSGGTWLLYKGGAINSTVVTVQANTGIGLTLDKKVYAVVVDGGNSAFSVGITFNDLGKIMLALGCSNAFSTSTGTSSVIVRRQEQRDINNAVIWKTLNNPTVVNGTANLSGIGFVLKN